MRACHFVALVFACSLLTQCASAADWLVAPSYYTHDPTTGQRVTQYAEIGPYYYYHRPDFQRSGYRNYRSTIQTGNSADNLHMVEEYGRPVRPYEEWRFPYRPYSVPYDAWGPPFGGLNGGGYGGYGGGFLGGFPNGPFPPNGPMGPGPMGPGPVGPATGWGGQKNYAQPWQDGYYPTYDRNDRSQYYRSYP
jgi:hypothetical protein